MYYRDCTDAYACEVIKEILEYAAAPWKALELTEKFLANEINTDEIGNEL